MRVSGSENFQNWRLDRFSVPAKSKNRPVGRLLFLQNSDSGGEGVSMSGFDGWTVCRFHGARGGGAERQAECNYRHGGRTKEMIEVWKLIK
jgi:hypothetical protein